MDNKHEWEIMTQGKSTSRNTLVYKWRCARCHKVTEVNPEPGRESVPPKEEEECVKR